MKKQIYLILHDIRSAENVGAMFRTADAAGVTGVYLTGYTPAPLDQFKRKNSKIAKAALGAEETIMWEKIKNISSVINKFRKQDGTIFALEQDKKSIDYKTVKLSKTNNKIALIVGNEINGLSKIILKHCDHIIEIPMRGEKESLNVSVATGIALFRILGI